MCFCVEGLIPARREWLWECFGEYGTLSVLWLFVTNEINDDCLSILLKFSLGILSSLIGINPNGKLISTFGYLKL